MSDRAQRGRGATTSWIRRAVTEHAGLKVISLALALALAVIVRGEREAVVAAVIAVEYVDPPPGRVLVTEPIETVRVLIKGPWTRIKRFEERAVPPIAVPIGGLTEGEFAIQPDLVQLPRGLEVVSISPRSVHVAYEPVEQREVPLRARVVGTPAPGWIVREVVVTPSHMLVRGGRSAITQLAGLDLSAVSIEGQSLEVADWARIVGVPAGVDLGGAATVEVRVDLVEDR